MFIYFKIIRFLDHGIRGIRSSRAFCFNCRCINNSLHSKAVGYTGGYYSRVVTSITCINCWTLTPVRRQCMLCLSSYFSENCCFLLACTLKIEQEMSNMYFTKIDFFDLLGEKLQNHNIFHLTEKFLIISIISSL